MADPNDQSGAGTTASDQPGGNSSSPDIEAIVTRAVAAALGEQDKRFQGFQSLIDRKFRDMSRQFKTAGLSPEEREQLGEEEEGDELDMLRREVEILRSRDRFPRGADLLTKLSEAETLEDQLSLIEQAFNAGEITTGEAAQAAQAAVAQEAASTDTTPVPEVDRNSPGRELKPGLASALSSGGMTDEVADALLADAPKGALRG